METDNAPDVGRVTSGERFAIAALTGAFVMLLCLWALITPLFHGPDESAHFNSAVRLASGGGWPAPGDARYSAGIEAVYESGDTTRATERTTYSDLTAATPGMDDRLDQMTQHPATYYLVAAGVLRVIGFEAVRWDVDVLALRGLSILLMTPVPLLVWGTVRRITRSPRAAIIGSTSLFLIPQLFQIGSVITNDSLAITVGCAITLVAAIVATGTRRWPILLTLGLLLGGGLLVKGTLLAAIPFVAAVLLFGRCAPTWPRRVIETFVTLGIGGLTGGWWWVRNILLFGNIQPSGLAGGRPDDPWPEGGGPSIEVYAQSLWNGISQSFWGHFGRLEVPLSAVLTDILTVLCLAVVVLFAFRRGQHQRSAMLLGVFPLSVLLMLGYTTWSIYARTQIGYGVQGRYFFVAVAALITLATIAALRLTPSERSRRGFAVAVAAGGLLLSLYATTVAFRGFYEDDPTHFTRGAVGDWVALAPTGLTGIAAVSTGLAVTVAISATALESVIRRRRRWVTTL